ncbi:MAG TPA: hypothetical protein VF604_13075 [Pyrinomonadaceae bacterium]|jgi:hypothetical protein
MKVNSISQITINLYDESKTRLSTIIVTEDVIKKTFEYKISSPNSEIEWVRINNEVKDGKSIASALSSSEKSMKILMLIGKEAAGCQSKNPLTELEVIDANGVARKFSQNIQTKEQKEEIQSFLKQIE